MPINLVNPPRDRVRAFLESKSPATFTPSEIARHLDGLTNNQIAGALHNMLKSTPQVQRVAKGKFRWTTDVDAEAEFKNTLRWPRFQVAQALARAGGEVTDPATGRATSKLSELIGRDDAKKSFALTGLLTSMDRDGEITREMNAKRTFKITLTDKGYDAFLLSRQAAPAEDAEDDEAVTPAAIAALGDSPADVWEDDVLNPDTEATFAGRLDEAPAPILPPALQEEARQAGFEALELIATISDLFAHEAEAARGAGKDDQARKLGDMHTYTKRLETEITRLKRRDGELSDLLAARKAEIEGQRRQLADMSRNLQVATEHANRIEGAALEEFKEWDKMVRSAPGFAKTG